MNIDKQKQKLLSEKETLEKDLIALGRKLDGNGDWVVIPDQRKDEHADLLDESNLTEDLEERIAVLNILEKRHIQVERALRAIKNDTYGICEEEGCSIREDRLLANPSATTCINHTK